MKKLFTCLSVLAILLMVFPAAAQDSGINARQAGGQKVYLVLMADDPVITYDGSIRGMPATATRGNKLNPNTLRVKRYASFLERKQADALLAAGIDSSAAVYHYTFALNGFAALMTADEAARVARQPGVVYVRQDELRHPNTDNSPGFLGLTAPGGPYAKGITGEGVVVGIIDTGIWPEHPSFADDGSYSAPPITIGECNFGNTAFNPNDAPFTCNNKLIGARQFMDTYKTLLGLEPDEYDSARDDDGHGTHTSSTSAGNAGVSASIFGIPRGTVSGIAPRARVVMYKTCASQGCFTSDTSAAIDQAVADGVDVINYSIGGGASLLGFDDLSFLFAADAGVFVATSAGNDGPGAGTVGGPASTPWVTAVGASTQDRTLISDITLSGPGSPPTGVWGASVTAGISDFNLVDAEGIADVDGDTSGLCLNAFAPGTFQSDDAVLCNQYDFGVARVVRVQNVADGGGGAVLFHNSTNVSVMPTDNHVLPTVHILNEVGNPLKAYLVANPGMVTVSFTTSTARYADTDARVTPNVMASFSSRGPDTAALDIIKPDVTAPGVNILAGASPIHAGDGAQGQLFQSILGTSMSSPHVAGIYALVKQFHPDWSPAMAKSALMTTAYQDVMKEDGITPADPFDMGAGHVNPGGKVGRKGSLFQPGLVYDAGFLDYLGFLCDAAPEAFANPAATCTTLAGLGIPTDASDLNLASIGIAELTGSQTVTRTVTDVGPVKGLRRYRVSVEAPAGYEVSVSPSSFLIGAGESVTYSVTFTNVSAPIGEWRFGSLTWRSGTIAVYSPIALRATEFDSPYEASGTGTTGSTSFSVKFGYSGSYSAAAHGLEAAVATVDNVLQDPDQAFSPADVAAGGADLHEFNLSGVAVFRVAIPPDATEAGADLDVYVVDPDGNLAGASTLAGTDELVDILSPMDGTWQVYVHGWLAPGGDSDYTMSSWVVSATPGGSLNIDSAPASATLGAIETIQVSWSGLTPATQYLGAVSHTGPGGLMGLTLISVDSGP